MRAHLLSRLILTIPVLLGASVIVFMVMQLLPGDPVLVMLGREGGASAEAVAKLREELGLNDPVYIQYINYLGRLLRGDMGYTIRTHRPVMTTLLEQLPATLELTFSGMLLALIVGVPSGCIAAIKRSSWLDNLVMTLAMSALAMPSFWLGILLILLFVYQLGWFPVISTNPLQTLVLPAVALGVRAAGNVARMTRSSMLDTLNQDYLRTARAKGLAEWIVITRHALRNALIPVVTMVGLQLGDLLGGAVVIETVFTRRGVGQLVTQAITNRDYPLVQGIVLFTAVTYVAINVLVDILYGEIDPRIRQQ